MKPIIPVTGDVVLDLNFYAGQRSTPDSLAACGTRYLAQPGGALLTYRLLDALGRTPADPAKPGSTFGPGDLVFGLSEMTKETIDGWPSHFKVGAVWEPFEGAEKGGLFWRLSKNLGYGPYGSKKYPATPAPDSEKMRPQVMVIDDGSLGFRLRMASSCWPPDIKSGVSESRLQWIILKMSSPLARGDLWGELVSRWNDRLIVVVPADDLRPEDAQGFFLASIPPFSHAGWCLPGRPTYTCDRQECFRLRGRHKP